MSPQLFDAGPYGAFVWPAYGVTLAGFIWMIADTWMRARRWRRALQKLERAKRP